MVALRHLLLRLGTALLGVVLLLHSRVIPVRVAVFEQGELDLERCIPKSRGYDSYKIWSARPQNGKEIWMRNREDQKEKIQQKNGITNDTTIFFRCEPSLACFTRCCYDVNIFLTPYDILRMKGRLKIPSNVFLEHYTLTLIPQYTGLPIIQLRMIEEEERRCPFVSEGGCRIYEDRPWACRMYPLDRIGDGDGYTFMVNAEICQGQKAETSWKVEDWFCDQGLGPYEEMDVIFQKMTLNKRLMDEGVTNPRLRDMYRMACYDLDTFRRFVFETRFLSIFELEPDVVEQIRTNDEALLLLAFRWLQFGFVAGDALPIKPEIIKGGTTEMEGKKVRVENEKHSSQG